MADKPILFSGPMVRAILDGRKSQTRRVLTPTAPFDPDDDISVQIAVGSIFPKYAVGDRLWIRESWNTWGIFDDLAPSKLTGKEGIAYAADMDDPRGESLGRVRPSIHMPRWASRITLHVTDVRVQRLQEINEADARAEGAKPWTGALQSYRTGFYHLWDSINGKRPGCAWDDDPWICAISFKPELRNIDAPEARHG